MISNQALIELNLGLAEAVITGGEIKGFNIINKGNGFPSNDAVLIGGAEDGSEVELSINSGKLAGYQNAQGKWNPTYTELNLNELSFLFC